MERTGTTIFYTCVLCVLVFIVLGCEEGDPLAPPVAAESVAGIYEFTRFEFTPNDVTIAPANFLDTLVAITQLELTPNSQFVLSYQFEGGSQTSIGGRMTANTRDVRLEAESGQETALANLFLNEAITLDRDNENLQATIESTVVLSTVFARYEGLPPVHGALEIILSPRGEN